MIDLDDEDAFLARLTQPAVPKDDEEEPEFKGFSLKLKPIVEPEPAPVEYDKTPLTKRLCTFDTETDPFRYGRVPKPFWAGFYDGETYIDFWGPHCIGDFLDYLLDRVEADPSFDPVIYAHNGGKFDFHLMMEYLDDDEKLFMVSGRMVKAFFCSFEFRDSFAIIPVAQGKFSGAKLKIDYDLFEADVREQHKARIIEYARHDVEQLWLIVNEYIQRFGWRITVASTALPYLQSFHGFNAMDRSQDDTIRPYYKGGRVQCFETGLIVAPPGKRFMMVDRNSMYPSEMRNSWHPVSAIPMRGREITDETDFAHIEAINRGALGMGGVMDFDFTVKRGKFFASIHEIRAGLDTGTLDILRVFQTYHFQHKAKFDTFVDHFYNLRLEAKANGDKMGVELYKLILNSAYGKLAMNTSGYKDWLVNPAQQPTPLYSTEKKFEEYFDGDGVQRFRCTHSPQGWRMAHEVGELHIWCRPTRSAGERFLNVATAASITGAARASLWRAICASERAMYCDTDSVICEATHVHCDDKELGAWKIEAYGDAVCIAGKKMYAFLSRDRPQEDSEAVSIRGEVFYVVKKAHKGVQLTGTDIANICQGAVIEHENMAPAFQLDGKVKFTKRRVRMTAGTLDQMELELDG